MTRTVSPRLGSYAALAATALVAALALGRPEIAALAVPMLAFLAAGTAMLRPCTLTLTARVEEDRVLEQEAVPIVLKLSGGESAAVVELAPALDARLVVPPESEPATMALAAGERRALRLPARATRWGAYAVGNVVVRSRDPLGIVCDRGRFTIPTPIRVYPRSERLRALVEPAETQLLVGSRLARERSEGIEFADLRAYVPGDRARSINWRATARRGAPFVNLRNPERNAEVVLLLDTFAEARDETGGTLDLAVRASASLAHAYLARRDRVGLVSFGGVLSWLTPGVGTRWLYRIVDALLASEIAFSYAWKDVAVVPPQLLPPRALVFAVTPLLDERSVTALLDLRGRGRDLAVLDVSPIPYASPGRSDVDRLAHRLWRLQRATLADELQRLGVPVVEWSDELALEESISEVALFRRNARHAAHA